MEVPDHIWAAADDLFRAALRLGGTLTGEHGIGVLKRRWLVDELGEDQWELQRQITRGVRPGRHPQPRQGLRAVTAPQIFVSAAVITDAAGRVLVVRKHGTSVFMQPGGKPEAGESAAEALSRELHEEVGLVVAPDALEPLGTSNRTPPTSPGTG